MDHNFFDSSNHHHFPPKYSILAGSLLAMLNYVCGWVNNIHPIQQYNVAQQFLINIVQAFFMGGIGAFGAYHVKKLIPKFNIMLQNLKQRWQAETPVIAKRITNLSVSLLGISLSVIGLAQVPHIAIPAIVIAAASKVAIVSTIVAPITKLQKKKEDETP